MVKLLTAREIHEGARLPWGYAPAYWRQWSAVAVCYPIGLHLVVSVARSLYTRFSHWRCPEGWETLWRVRYERGREQGRAEGYAAAWRHFDIVRETENRRG